MKTYLKVCLFGLLAMGLFASCKPEPPEEKPVPASGLNFTATCNGKTIVDGATIEVNKLTEVYGTLEADFLIKATANMNFSMKFEEVNPEDAIITICGFGGCRAGNSIDNVTLEAGKTYGGEADKIDIAYIVMEEGVKATMKVTMRDNTAGKELVFTLVLDPSRN